MVADLTVKQGNLLPVVPIICRDSVGPVDLDDHTALFRMVNVLNGELKIPREGVTGEATVSASLAFTVDATTNVLTSAAHGLNDGDDVTLKSSGTLPGGLDNDTKYFVINRTANTLQLSLAQGGSAADITSTGSGAHSLLSGKISYEWVGGDTEPAGTYLAEVQTFKDGKPLTYPNTHHLLIEIISSLTDGSDRTKAVKAAWDRVQPNTAPTLTQGEVELEVDRAQLATVWTINTAYNIGDIIVPAIRNGHCYECTQPGTSQGSVLSYSDWPLYTGSTRADGGSDPQLIWTEAGSDVFNPGIFGAERNVYDINRAIKNCVGIKVARCAQMVTDGDTSFSHLYEHWTKEAEKYYPFRRAITLVRC